MFQSGGRRRVPQDGGGDTVRLDERFRTFAEGIGAAVVVSDPDGIVQLANSAAEELFADLLVDSGAPFEGSAVTDHGWRLLREDGAPQPMAENAAGRARATGQPVRDHVIGLVVGDRAPVWLVQSAVPFEREGQPGRYDVVSTFVDITARRELEARLELQASSDPLTGLSNRLRYEERLTEAARRADRAGEPLCLVLLDVDDFKSCNDLHGHAAGDAVLVAVAERLRGLVRPTDTVARLGGDEFAIVVEGADEDRARELAERAVGSVGCPVRLPRGRRGAVVLVTTSVGVAVRAPGGDVAALEQAADEALFAAKHAGKDTFVLHEPGVDRSRSIEVEIAAEDAHAWAGYIDQLRTEIALRKAEGRLPASAGAPPSVHRVLQDVLARVARLPATGRCTLSLPRERDLGPFVFHHDGVNRWVAQLRDEGVVGTPVPDGAARFWTTLRGTVDAVGV
jgi:diguanylate cyclase (GGDEF)-like protein